MRALWWCAILVACGAGTTRETMPSTPDDAETAWRADYREAVALAAKDDLAGASALLARRGAALAAAGHHDLAALVWNSTTWIRWAMNDLDGALAENARMGAAVDQVDDEEIAAGLRLHELWDRAYLLRDRADRVGDGERAAALSAADVARASYEIRAPADAQDGTYILQAYFAWRAGDQAAAAAAARKVDLDSDTDAQDLYIAALALEGAGDAEAAAKLRARAAEARYIMRELLRHFAESTSRR